MVKVQKMETIDFIMLLIIKYATMRLIADKYS